MLGNFFSQGGIDPTEISPNAGGEPWICNHPCHRELKKILELQDEFKTLYSKLRVKISATYGVEDIPVIYSVETAQGTM